MFINPRQKEINLKIVYYGPGRGGKTTNLEHIHAKTKPQLRGDLVSLKTSEDRTLFFDYMQMELGSIKGLRPKFNLYTVPGQVQYTSSRKLVLKGADAVVFVCDSQKARLEASLASYRDLHRHMKELGMSPANVPIVMQFNKQDLPTALPADFLQVFMGLTPATPAFEAVAINGQGVFDTLKAAITQVIQRTQKSQHREQKNESTTNPAKIQSASAV